MELQKIRSMAAQVRKEAERLVKPGATYLEVVQKIESYIRDMGARPAFPVNISINEVAAHYTPSLEEEEAIRERDVVKVDFGIYYEGTISDNAVTVDLSGERTAMVDVANKALEEGISMIRPGVRISEVSRAISDVIKEGGFKAIANLTGHKIEGEVLHSGVSLPNVVANYTYEFKEGDVFAVEPFITTKEGAGVVVDTDRVEIYSFLSDVVPRLRESRVLLNHIKSEYGMLPFAERWIQPRFKSRLLLIASLKELLKMHSIQAYAVLREGKGQVVVQAEKTVVVTKDGVEPLS